MTTARASLEAARRSSMPGFGAPNPSPEYRALTAANRAVVDRLTFAPGGITAAHAAVARNEALSLRDNLLVPPDAVREADNFATVLGQSYTRVALAGMRMNPATARSAATDILTGELTRPHLIQALTDLRPNTAAAMFSSLAPGEAFGQQGDLARVLRGDSLRPGLSADDLFAVQARLDATSPIDAAAFGRYFGRTTMV